MTNDELADRIADLAEQVAHTDRLVQAVVRLQEQNSHDIARLYEMWVESRKDIRRLYEQWPDHLRGHG